MTRSVVALLHGDIGASVYYHPLGVVIVVAAAIVALIDGWRWWRAQSRRGGFSRAVTDDGPTDGDARAVGRHRRDRRRLDRTPAALRGRDLGLLTHRRPDRSMAARRRQAA